MSDKSLVQFEYVNHKGERAVRRVRPMRIWFGSTAWHPESQWLLEAFDLDRMATRDFSIAAIQFATWMPCDIPSICPVKWEEDRQRRILQQYGLAEEFPFGCDAIDCRRGG